MADLLTCSRGHQWEAPAPPTAAEQPPRCPVCGQTGHLVPRNGRAHDAAEAATLPPPNEAQTLPPEPPADETAEALPSVPGYEVLGVLGRGGMGVVYRARQQALGRVVALKMVLAGGHAGPAELARFRAEAEAIARLQHPHIVQVYEVGEQGGLPYFSLEFCGGGSLAGTLDGTPWPARRAAELIETLARAMHAAHQAGIVHRDLKPANVLLTADGTPKVTDFGLAKKLDDSAGPTQSGAIMGTPSYMAPEQAGGRSKEIGPAADVYALGAILYELLAGRPPFKAATPMDTVLQVLSDEPVLPSRLQPKTPRDLETVCLKCLQKEPAQRYASAEALADEVRRFLAGEPVHARPVGAGERLRKWFRRRPAVAALAGVSGVALLALVAAAVALLYQGELKVQRDEAEIQRQYAEQQQQEAERQRQLAQEQHREADAQRLAAEQQRGLVRRLLYLANMNLAYQAWQQPRIPRMVQLLEAARPKDPTAEDLRGFEWHYLWRLCHSEVVTLWAHTSPVDHVAFSPDGRCLASIGWGGIIKLWDPETGQVLWTLSGFHSRLGHISFSSDSKRFLATSTDGIRVWEITSGRQVGSLPWQENGLVGLAFSRDGNRVAAARGNAIEILDVSTGHKVQTLTGHKNGIYDIAFSPDGQRLASASADRTAKVWDISSGRHLQTFPGDVGHPARVVFSPSGKQLAGAGSTGMVEVWDVDTGRVAWKLPEYHFDVKAIAFSPDGKVLANSYGDGTIWLRDATSGKLIGTIRGHDQQVSDICFRPDGKLLASSSWDTKIKLWSVESDQEAVVLRGNTERVHQVAFSPDGRHLTGASSNSRDFPVAWADVSVTRWDTQTGQRDTSLAVGEKDRRFMGFTLNLDGSRAAACTALGTATVWDLRTGQQTRSLADHAFPTAHLALSPDGSRLAGAQVDGVLKLWDLENGQEIWNVKGQTPTISTKMTFSPNGRYLAVATPLLRVNIWDAATGRGVTSLAPAGCVAFSFDGKRIATASGASITMWDVPTGQKIRTLEGHDPGTGVQALAFSSDDQRLASFGGRQEIKLWDVETGQEALTLTAHDGVTSLVFSPDGKCLAAGGSVVRLWR